MSDYESMQDRIARLRGFNLTPAQLSEQFRTGQGLREITNARRMAVGPGGGYAGGSSQSQMPADYTGGWPSWGKNQYYPEMPDQSPAHPDPREYGAPGTAIFSGIIYGEEYNPDLYWREAVRIYDQMRRNDYQINATNLIVELPIIQGTYKVEPADDSPESIEHASFIETALFHELEQTWESVLRHACLAMWYGFMVMEKVYKRGSDGYWYWQKFAPRMPKTIWRWWVDDANELVGIQQWTFKEYTYRYINIPSEKLIHFAHRMEGNNFEGVALLRSAYKPWFYKEILLRIMGIGFEREHVGIPVFKMPLGASNADRNAAANMGKNMRANEQAYITLPFGWDVDWLQSKSGGRSSSHTPILDAIALLDVAIARNVLAQFINLGSAETGSYALSSDQSDLFLMMITAFAKDICNTLNNIRLGAIPQLVNFNFGRQEMYPKLVPHGIQSFDIGTVGSTLANLARFGLITPDLDVENFLRDSMGIPKTTKTAVEANRGAPSPLQVNSGPVDPNAGSGVDDPRDPGAKRSKGPGQDKTQDFPGGSPSGGGIRSNEIVPEQFRTQRYLHEMNHTWRRVHAGMVRERMKPYQLLSEGEWEQAERRLNRVTPSHPTAVRREQALQTRLKRSYREMERELLGTATDEVADTSDTADRSAAERPYRHENDDIKQLAEQVGIVTQAVRDALTRPPSMPTINVQPPSVVISEGAIQLRMEAGAMQATTEIAPGAIQSDVHIDPGAVKVDSPVTVQPQHIDARTTFEKGSIETHAHVDPGAVRLNAPVTIAKGAVQVDAPVDASTTIAEGAIKTDVNPTINVDAAPDTSGEVVAKYDPATRTMKVRRRRL